jgi:hypothetical protein
MRTKYEFVDVKMDSINPFGENPLPWDQEIQATIQSVRFEKQPVDRILPSVFEDVMIMTLRLRV